MTSKPFISCPGPENSRAIPGAVFNFLVRGEQTRNSFSLVKIEVQHGNEPPAHTHSREDEFYYILKGRMKFTVGEQIINAKAGDCVYLPMNISHAFEVKDEKAEVLMWISPATMDQWFWDNSVPAPDGKPLPVPQAPPSSEMIQHFVTSLQSYGVHMK